MSITKINTYEVNWSKTYITTGTIKVEAASHSVAEMVVADMLGGMEGSMQYIPDLDVVEAFELPPPLIIGMTTKQAEDKHQCANCKLGSHKSCTCYGYDWTCVENVTSSLRCPECNERVWFSALRHSEKKYICPYCSNLGALK